LIGAFEPTNDPEDDPRDDPLPGAIAALERGLGDAMDDDDDGEGGSPAARQARRYQRYSKEAKAELFDRILEQKHREKTSWDDLAAAFGVARSTIADWRRSEEWRLAEARWRRIMREETRTDATGLGKDALEVMAHLMHHARSEFVQ
jgi:transposase-like protein